MGVKEWRMVSKATMAICIIVAISAFYKIKTWEDKVQGLEKPTGTQYTVIQKNENGAIKEYKVVADSYLTPENLKTISESIVSKVGGTTGEKKDIVIKMYKSRKEVDGFPNIAQVKYTVHNKKYTIIPYLESLK